MPKLKVGDKIFRTSANEVLGSETIVRLTKTQAISSSGTKFKIDYDSNNYLNQLGRDTWSRTWYYLSSPELERRYHKQKVVAKLSKVNWDKLPLEKLNEVFNSIKNEITE